MRRRGEDGISSVVPPDEPVPEFVGMGLGGIEQTDLFSEAAGRFVHRLDLWEGHGRSRNVLFPPPAAVLSLPHQFRPHLRHGMRISQSKHLVIRHLSSPVEYFRLFLVYFN